MQVVKTSNFIGENPRGNLADYLKNVDNDLISLFLFGQGRVRFGEGTTGTRGENISGEFVTYTSNGSVDTEDTIAHTIGAVPIGYIVIKQDKAGSLYDSGTSWTDSNVYLKCDVASVTFSLFLLK